MNEWWMEHKDFLIALDEKLFAFDKLDKENDDDKYRQAVRELCDMAMRLADIADTEEKYEDIDDIMSHAILFWLEPLPYYLAQYGFIDEAANLGRRWAAITDGENFLGDRAVILAEAGRRDETYEQIDELNQKYPEDVWIQIKIGDAYRALKDWVPAETQYKKILETAKSHYDQDGVLERLIPMLLEQGRKDEADEIEERVRISENNNLFKYKSDEFAVKSVPSNPKTGRNEPCPCGSGKKYKKCCGKEL